MIAKSGYKEFPPRLEWQPIFYPVLNKEYARQIAGEWNVKDKFSGYVGYVLEFEVDDEFLRQFNLRTVGTNRHQEFWIPSERLKDFNAQIQGEIKVIVKFQ